MNFPRTSGVLLHPTCLPGPFGIGDMGKSAYEFVDFLAETGQGVWQLMPLGPTGFGDSPYSCFSAFAGNPLLIDPQMLHEQNLLSSSDLEGAPSFPADRVDYGRVIPFKSSLLEKAFATFERDAGAEEKNAWEEFCRNNASWLDDYALFMALKQTRESAWIEWEPDLVKRKPKAVEKASRDLDPLCRAHKFYQYLFFNQWKALKHYANRKGVRIIGDIPVFVAYDSVEVWANPHLFYLDKNHRPTVVAGVPPDYFSKTGQLWGNPLYRWDVMEKEGFSWWLSRFRMNLVLVDVIRLDHFRGFESYWEVPATDDTAVNGHWVKAPGEKLFQTLRTELGEVPIIAEDLGLITPEVEELRDAFGFPGMKVLQFAFAEGPENPYLPHNYSPNCVVYTGTHDNDTSLGWYRATSSEKERDYLRRYMASDGSEIHWDLIRLAFSSVAHTAVIPLQDILGLGGEARMNFPGKPSGNWQWRYTPDQLSQEVRGRLGEMTRVYGRQAKQAGS